MKWFVTGATGFLGGSLVRQLRSAGHEVVALVRDPARAGDLEPLGVRLHTGDVTDSESMRTGMENADGVFHLAAWYKLGAPDADAAERINVGGTRNVLELMRDLHIPRCVYTSTLAVFSDTKGKVVDESHRFDGRHLSVYDRTKAAAHYDVALPMMREGLPLTVVLPGVVYGPGDRSAVHDTWVRYLRGGLPFVPAGTAYSWSHVDDTAHGHILAMERGAAGESYIIAGPSHTLVEALQIASRITGIPASTRRIPPSALRCLATVMRIVGAVIPLPPDAHPERLRVAAGATYLGDSTKAKHELGYDPRPLEVGLAETLAYEMKMLGMDLDAHAPPRA